jgi:polysaccharide export outer membrane protein
MRDNRRGTTLTVVAALVGLSLTQTGCQTLSSHWPWSRANKSEDVAVKADRDANVYVRAPGANVSVQGKESTAAPAPQNVAAQATLPAANGPLRPRMELDWTIEAEAGQHKQPLAGRSIVGPDGSMDLGPYGTVKVAGLTVSQANTAVEKQLRRYLSNPRARLRLVTPTGDVTPATFHPTMQWSSDPAESHPLIRSAMPAEHEGSLILVSSREADPPDIFAADHAREDKSQTPPRLLPVAAATPVAFAPQVVAPSVPGHGSDFAVPRESNRVTLPPYVIGPPDILQIESVEGLKTQPVQGPHLVRPDGTVSIGAYGSAYVSGMTLEQAKTVVARVIAARLDPKKVTFEDVLKGLNVDVVAYNSKVYYVITDGGGYGEQVSRLPITGSETVLDAISLNTLGRGSLTGLPPVASKKHIWVARPGPDGQEQVLPVDWIGITQRGQTATNYQLLPGDRVYVKADHWRTFGATVDKVVTPIERLLGVTLLGSQTVNSIRTGTVP